MTEYVFHTALALAENERAKYLHGFADSDPQLVAEVTSLLSSYENEADFLDAPVVDLGLSVIHKNGHEERVNTIVGSYAIGGKLGSGGMGDVYEAIDTKLNRKVALKFLSDSLREDGAAKRQLRKEAQAIAMLEHPNICAVYGIEQSGDDDFIVMQYIDGVPLDQALRDIEIDQPNFVSIAGQIAGAVAFAHGNGIIHRDLKPANIMLTDDGTVKVLDFGLAKIVEQKNKFRNTPESVGLSGEGLIVGTIAYMSPEQLRGELLDYQTDIFSLGVIFYEILTKTSPFQRQTKAETISAILNDHPDYGLTGRAKISSEILTLVEDCLQKDKDKRLFSARVLNEKISEPHIHVNTPIGTPIKERFGRAIISLAALVAVMFGLFYLGKASGLFQNKATVAILPITFNDPEPARLYLADDLTQSIVHKFSRISTFTVKNASFSESYKKDDIDPQAAGNELRSDFVLASIIEKSGHGLVLKTRILRTSDGSLLDSSEITADPSQIAAMPQNVVSRVIEVLGVSITDADRDQVAKRETESSEAKNQYLIGLYYTRQNKDGNQIDKAIEAFTRAKDIDQNYAKAWAGLATAYLFQSSPGAKEAIRPDQSADLARKAAGKAIELDDTLPDAYYALAQLNRRWDWNWQNAEVNERTAISLDPQFLPARYGLVNSLRMQRRYDEALAESANIREIDPVTISTDVQDALIYYRRRDFQTAEAVLMNVLNRSPENQRIKNILPYILLLTGRPQDAARMLEPMYNSSQDGARVTHATPLGMAYAKMGLRENAVNVIRDLDEIAKRIYVPAQEKALIYMALGDYDRSFDGFKLACEERFPSYPGVINDPIVDELRADPRFAEMRQCANL